MTVEESIDFFDDKRTRDLLKRIDDMGLGYMTLGQPLSTFSGGERQRLKLAIQFDERGQIFVFDEPTTGLHPSDIEKLMLIFQKLVDQGNTVIIIEHNLDVISRADWVIDIGPGGGNNGGSIVFEGRVKDLLNNEVSRTAKYLRKYLERMLETTH